MSRQLNRRPKFGTTILIAASLALTQVDWWAALAQELPYLPPPDPGVGVLGSGPSGLPGPPAQPRVINRPSGWPGSPDVEAAAQAAPIMAPHPVSFHGMAPPPADLTMYRQQLAAQRPVQNVAAAAPNARLNQPPQASGAPGYGALAPVNAAPWQSSPVASGAPPAQPGGYPARPPYPAGPSAPGTPPGAPPVAQAAARPMSPARQPGAGFTSSVMQQQRASSAMALALPGALEIDGATVVAQVDGHAILASELLPAINWKITKNADRLRPEELPAARQYLMQQELESSIMLKLLVTAAKRKIPEKGYAQLSERIAGEFNKEQVPKLMEEYQVQTRTQLEAHLRSIGTSLEREKRAWTERIIAQQWLFSQHQAGENETTHEQLLNYYHANVSDFQFPSRVRWEQLSVDFGSKRTKAEARMRIAMAGDRILRGEPFADVAKAFSDGSTARAGGQRDWTTRGSLASDLLDEALFTMPVGRMSTILEDPTELHIVRVIEREDEGQTPFVEAQEKIKAALAKDDQRAERQKYMEELREKAIVWTIFDRDTATDQVSAQSQSPPR